MVNYAVISGTVIDAAGNPVPNASIIFNPIIPQVVQGQYIQPILVNSLTGDDGVMIPISLPWGIMVQITVNNAAPFTVVVPSIGAVEFGALAMNAWPVLTFAPPTFTFIDDFLPVATSPWTLYSIGGAATVAPLTAEQDHPGIERLTTPAVAGQGGSLALSSSALVQATYGLINNSNWQMAWTWRLNQLTDEQFFVGLVNDFATITQTYIGIRYDTTVPDFSYQFVCSDTGLATVVDAGIADTNWHTLKISMAAPGIVLFQLDARPVQQISTSLPSAGLTPAIQLISAAAAEKTVDRDFFSFACPSFAR